MADLLTPDQIDRLAAIAATGENRSVQQRAQLLLGYQEGKPTAEISAEIGLSPSRVRHWRREFRKRGFDIFPDNAPLPVTEAEAAALDAPQPETVPKVKPAKQKKGKKKAKTPSVAEQLTEREARAEPADLPPPRTVRQPRADNDAGPDDPVAPKKKKKKSAGKKAKSAKKTAKKKDKKPKKVASPAKKQQKQEEDTTPVGDYIGGIIDGVAEIFSSLDVSKRIKKINKSKAVRSVVKQFKKESKAVAKKGKKKPAKKAEGKASLRAKLDALDERLQALDDQVQRARQRLDASEE